MEPVLVIIGAGQLGSRHLQGLLKSKSDMEIQIVEPNLQSKINAEKCINEIDSIKNKVTFLNKISEVSDQIVLAIVATSADVRYEVCNELLKTKKVKFLILEKVLFQDAKHYELVRKKLINSGTKCWVNHPRRCFDFYKELRSLLDKCKFFHFSISGGDWGLGCNSLHFIDLISFLTKDKTIKLSFDYINRDFKESKRLGFLEFTGAIVGNTDKSHFLIESFQNKSPIQISISSDLYNIFIDEASGWARIFDNKSKESKVLEGRITRFQSELTDKVVDDLLASGECDLTSYSDACCIHESFTEGLLNYINYKGKVCYKVCPIT